MHIRGPTNSTILDPDQAPASTPSAEMTGDWQILGSRGRLAEVVKLDYLYVVACSLWSYVKIPLPTLPHVWARPGT